MRKILLVGLLVFCRLGLAESSDVGYKKQFYEFGAGPAYVAALNTPYLITAWRAAFGVQFHPRFDLRLLADWTFSSTNTDMHDFSLMLGSNYYFSDDPVTPYVALDLGYGSMHAHFNCVNPSCESPADDADGMAAAVAAGARLFKNSCTYLNAQLRYEALLATTRYGMPQKLELEGIIGF